ncbi:murein L,D-transpeptidase [Pedobacter sp. ASV28]|uniref:L,D-transpeptidase family protein n=1 Tax=Pedobacter sp. ASV28 TaxID=2795123 RepID=UPI0018ED9A59|nr:L,D-transpeptidase family protein [Pedobacter sp. ASV28]
MDNGSQYFSKLSKQLVGFACLGLFFLSMGCNGRPTDRVGTRDNVVKKVSIDVRTLRVDTLAIHSFLSRRSAFTEFAEDFKAFYSSQGYHYVWFDQNGLIEAAQHLLGRINAEDNDGILKKLPYKEELSSLMDQQKEKNFMPPSLELELMLTAQYFSYAKNRWGGAELAKAKDIGWYLPGKKLSYSELLKKQLTVSSADVEQEAVIPQYIALRKMLNHYQELEKKEKEILVPQQEIIKQPIIGDTLAMVTKLRERLFQLGDLQRISPSKIYDQELADAVLRFKKRHGIKEDPSLDSRFLKEINVPLRARIQQIMINMERMRWIPLGDHGSKFILVNIPAFQLYYYENNKLSWTCKVVVGKEMSQTVIFAGNLQNIVFSPYWYVPQDIIKKEILPEMKKDPDYLDKHHMEWNNGHVRQKPGADNSLGLIKFIFPNVNDIYLHDTPSKPLFNEDIRAFSHGCIRVEQPKELAQSLLEDMPIWTSKRIDLAMRSGKEQWVSLKTKVPVYIGYFTAYVDSAGQLNFREDIYHKDARLLDMLMQ